MEVIMHRFLLASVFVFSFACGSKQKEAVKPKASAPDRTALIKNDQRAPKPKPATTKVRLNDIKLAGTLRGRGTWKVEKKYARGIPIYVITHQETGVYLLVSSGKEKRSLIQVARGLHSIFSARTKTSQIRQLQNPPRVFFAIERKLGNGLVLGGKVIVLHYPGATDRMIGVVGMWPKPFGQVERVIDAFVLSLKPMK